MAYGDDAPGIARFGRAVPWLLLVVCLSAIVPGRALAQTVAMVTDVSGKVAGQPAVTIMAEIAAGGEVRMEPGAKLVVIYVKSGEEYSFGGPARIRFQPGGPQVLSGAPAQKRPSPLARGGNVTIRPVAVTQAAFVMRSLRPTARIKLLTLSGTKTLETAPEFRWRELDSGLTYRFELTDDTGRSLQEAQVKGSAFNLPDSVRLREGITYTWRVSTSTPDGRRYVSAGDFTVAAPELRAEVDSLRPADGASVSDRVAYAAWLEQVELKDEARRYWKALATERPEDEKLKALAGE